MSSNNPSVRNYVNVKLKAKKLDCNVPEGLALLPRNFEDAKSKSELVHEDTAITVRKLLKYNTIPETPLEKIGEKYSEVSEKAYEWIGPTIFVSTAFVTQNPHVIEITINVISNYLTDWFKGIPKDNRKCRLSIVSESKSGKFKKIDYSGSEEGLKELPKIVKELHNE